MSRGIIQRTSLAWLFCLSFPLTGLNAQITVTGQTIVTGTVIYHSGENISIKSADGDVVNALISTNQTQQVVTLKNGTRLNAPLDAKIEGKFDITDIDSGDVLQFEGSFNRLGRTEGNVNSITLMLGSVPTQIRPLSETQTTANEFRPYLVTANYNKQLNDRLLINVPANKYTKQNILSFQLHSNCNVVFESTDPKLIRGSMKVTRATILELNTGDFVVESISLQTNRKPKFENEFDNILRKKYSHLSTSPMEPRLIRSQNFVFMSDISEQEAKILLEKLETMHSLLSGYFRAKPNTVIEGFIVQDITKWPDGLLQEPAGIAKIKERAGICFSSSLGNTRRAVVYSFAEHGVVQHESTHGFCSLAFGSTGPTWLAEGVAELGQYWRLGKRQVSLPSHVIDYIRNSPQRPLLQIAVPGRVPAGNWQDYAWRWALCHLLANNPNYAARFRPLAVSLMQQNSMVSFANTYGDIAPQISFEYRFFLAHLQNGYRSDLCAWQWNQKFSPLVGERIRKTTIQAKYGWQASRLILEKGKAYDIAAVGKWAVSQESEEITAGGDERGNGVLAGVLFHNFTLSAEFELGERAVFTAPQNGQLFLRCKEPFESIADNSGEIEVYMRLMP